MNFFQGFFYRPGDPGTNDFFLKYGMSFFCWEYFLLMFLSVTAVITMIILLKLKNFDIYKQMRVCLVITTCLEILKILFFTINRKMLLWSHGCHCFIAHYLTMPYILQPLVKNLCDKWVFLLFLCSLLQVFVECL